MKLRETLELTSALINPRRTCFLRCYLKVTQMCAKRGYSKYSDIVLIKRSPDASPRATRAVCTLKMIHRQVHSMLRVVDGYNLGVRWAEQFGRRELLSLFELVLREYSGMLKIGTVVANKESWVASDPKAFARLLGAASSDDEDESDYVASDCNDFLYVLKPFIRNALDDLLATRDEEGIMERNLADPHFLGGFLAGALRDLVPTWSNESRRSATQRRRRSG